MTRGTTPATHGATRGGSRSVGKGGTQSLVRPVVVGQDVQYPLGTSLRKTLFGYNYGNWGTVTVGADGVVNGVAEAIADGVKIVRVVSNFRWFGPYGLAGTDSRNDTCFASFDPSNWAVMKAIVKQLGAAGIWVVITFDSDCAINGGMQDGPGGTDATYCEAQVQVGETPMTMAADGSWSVVGGTWAAAGGYNVYTSPVLFAKVREIWKMAANEFRSYPYVFAYELASEPMSGGGFDYLTAGSWNTRLQSMYRLLCATVGTVDTVTPKILGGRGGYNKGNLAEVVLTERTDCMYTWDILSNGLSVSATLPANFDTVCAAAQAANVPLFLNQMGSKSAGTDDPNDYGLKGGFRIARARGIITTWWQNRDKVTNANGYGLRYSDGASGFIDKVPRLANFQAMMGETLATLEAAALAAAAAEGAVLFYVKPDFSNVFQDSAGTTPVTALGQPLGLINPVVGAGITLNQPTALNRPTVAAATSYLVDQRPCMSFDGVNGWLQGSVIFFSSLSQMTVICSAIPSGTATTQDLVYAGSSTGTPKWPRLQASSAKVAQANWQSDTTTNVVTGTTATNNFPLVMTCIRDGLANKSLWCNGVQDGATNSTADAAIATLNRLRVGGNTSNNATLAGVIGCICLKVGTMSLANRQAIERFAGFLVGAGYQV